jgi:multiple sugar transport system ATP-binding protein
MAQVELKQVDKIFTDPKTKQETYAVRGLDLAIRDGEFLVLVGPSGCGKTTALRMIAGLEEISNGTITIGGKVVNDILARDRDIAMVFQNYALYPHMSVYDNMAFGLRLREMPPLLKRIMQREKSRAIAADIDARIRSAAAQLDLEHLLGRKPSQLSGGQRQRVALGRAVVRQPSVFLMDEPLSNLDAKLRVQTRAELVKLHRRLGVTTIYVTHDQVEAMTMGQRIAVMRDGQLQQCDTPLALYKTPANMFVAGFIGTPAMNFLNGKLYFNGARDSENLRLDLGFLKVPFTASQFPAAREYENKEIVFGIRPEDIYDANLVPPSAGTNLCKVRMNVEVVEPMGAQSIVFLKSGESELVASLDAASQPEMGGEFEIALNIGAAHLFDPKTELAL